MLQQNTRYSYTYNHVWLTIYRNDTEVAMLQCSEAHCLADALEVAPDYIQQSILSQYDYTTDESKDDTEETIGFYLESLIDKYSLSHILGLIADICGNKSEHLLCQWQDTLSAKVWHKAAIAVIDAATSVDC
jgi:hypothetical protein